MVLEDPDHIILIDIWKICCNCQKSMCEDTDSHMELKKLSCGCYRHKSDCPTRKATAPNLLTKGEHICSEKIRADLVREFVDKTYPFEPSVEAVFLKYLSMKSPYLERLIKEGKQGHSYYTKMIELEMEKEKRESRWFRSQTKKQTDKKKGEAKDEECCVNRKMTSIDNWSVTEDDGRVLNRVWYMFRQNFDQLNSLMNKRLRESSVNRSLSSIDTAVKTFDEITIVANEARCNVLDALKKETEKLSQKLDSMKSKMKPKDDSKLLD